MSVVLLERSTLPRHKVCGGGIPRRTAALLPDGYREHTHPHPIHAVSLVGGWGRRLDLPVPDAPCAEIVDRSHLDLFLCNQAISQGAILRSGMPVKSVARSGGCWNIGLGDGPVVSARNVAVADGALSPVSGMLGLARGRMGVALEGYVPIPEWASATQRHSTVFHFDCIFGGYGWIFPRGDTYAVGIGTNRRTCKKIASLLTQFCWKSDELGGVSPTGVRGALLPCFDTPRDWYAREGLYLLGDAAGLCDPLTGEGIFYAVKSGMFCADALADGGEAVYERLVRAELVSELAIAARFAWKATWCPRWLLGLLMGSTRYRRYAELFVSLLAGTITYRDLYNRMHRRQLP